MPAPSARDNLHSRVVTILKVTLPLLALAVLSSLFLFSRGIDPEDAIPYADVDIADRLAEPRMTGAGFSTMTADGTSLTFGADEAVPGAGGAEARGLSGVMQTAEGARTEITAAKVVVDNAKGLMVLTGGVALNTSTGMAIDAEGFDLATDRTWLESHGAVQAKGPMGDLSAGALRLDKATIGPGYVLVFNKGVRLLYQPKH